jgi:hypothetical protein
MSHQHGVLDARVFHDSVYCPGKQVHRVIDVRLVALAVAREVDQNDTMAVLKERGLPVPKSQVARPAMHKDQRIASLS